MGVASNHRWLQVLDWAYRNRSTSRIHEQFVNSFKLFELRMIVVWIFRKRANCKLTWPVQFVLVDDWPPDTLLSEMLFKICDFKINRLHLWTIVPVPVSGFKITLRRKGHYSRGRGLSEVRVFWDAWPVQEQILSQRKLLSFLPFLGVYVFIVQLDWSFHLMALEMLDYLLVFKIMVRHKVVSLLIYISLVNSTSKDRDKPWHGYSRSFIDSILLPDLLVLWLIRLQMILVDLDIIRRRIMWGIHLTGSLLFKFN